MTPGPRPVVDAVVPLVRVDLNREQNGPGAPADREMPPGEPSSTTWRDIAEILSDEVVIAAPARDIVPFWGAGSAPNRRALPGARDRVLAVGDHATTKDLFRVRAARWQPFCSG
jgi:hypothetical protein